MAVGIAKQTLKGPADEMYGYAFGCDGLVSFKEACKLLGGICSKTLYRRIADGSIRKGKLGTKKAVICKRSLQEYIQGLES